MAEITDYIATQKGDYTDCFTLEELKSYLRLTSTDFDAQLESLAIAGIEFVEAFTGYSLRTRTSRVLLDYPGTFRAFYPPVTAVTIGGEMDANSTSLVIGSEHVVEYTSGAVDNESLKSAAMEYVNQRFNNPDANLAKVREICKPWRAKPTFL